MDSKSIADVLLSTLEAWGMDFSGLVGQGYNGAAVMSSSKNSVQGRIHEKYPNATYVHCHSDVLSLAISSDVTNNSKPY